METLSTVVEKIDPGLYENIPELDLLLSPAQSEPTDNDLSDLDALLAESEAIKKKAQNKRRYHETKEAVEQLEERQIQWKVLDYAEVWTMTRCARCGAEGKKTFVRRMRKSRQVGGKTGLFHWETVEEFPRNCSPKMALVLRPVHRCEDCAGIKGVEFQDFSEVMK